MSVRYAVLWDLDDKEGVKGDPHAAVPIGVVVDRGDFVQVRLPGPDNYCITERFDQPYEHVAFDTEPLFRTVNPGDDDYFGCVLNSLFYTFAITMPDQGGDGQTELRAPAQRHQDPDVLLERGEE